VVNRLWEYPIPEFGGVYAPDVLVFRGNESEGYPFLSTPEKMSFVAVAAYKHPTVEEDSNGRPFFPPKIRSLTKRKIRAMFSIARKHGHDALILSAWGCGAYGNPPQAIAALFRGMILKEGLGEGFKYIYFAILSDGNDKREHNKEGNAKSFSKVWKLELKGFDDWKENEEDQEKKKSKEEKNSDKEIESSDSSSQHKPKLGNNEDPKDKGTVIP